MEPNTLSITRAVIIGAGTMGAQIAAMLANVGISSFLLDVVPTELTEEERKKGLSLKDAEVRNRITKSLWARALKLSPSPLFVPENAEMVVLGNVEDDQAAIADADWIIEAVVEKLEVKKTTHALIAKHAREDAIVTTNTSGIPIAAIAGAIPEARRPRFFGAHFFNPPRSMRLLEIITTPETDSGCVDAFSVFAEGVLGKGVVRCKDTPGFISNRIGYFAIQHAVWLAFEERLQVEEVDAITGPAIGRPKSGTFRLCDLIGLDLMAHIGHDLVERLPSDDRKKYFEQAPFAEEMLRRGWLGEKSGQGYYQRVRTDNGSRLLALDLKSLEYREIHVPEIASLKGGIRNLCQADDKAGRFAWKHLSAVLRYGADKLEEIADDVVSIDNVLKWGFNWEMGPFEIWDALGVADAATRMEKDGDKVPVIVEQLLQSGKKSFYEQRGTQRYFYDFRTREYAPVPASASDIHLQLLRNDGKVVFENAGASLIDLGDGVACLEFHSKMNALGPDQLEIVEKAKEEVRKNFAGLVIGNQAKNFSAGVNLKLFVDFIQKKDWNGIDQLLQRFQRATCGWAGFEKPVVVACQGYCLGAGCETVLGAEHVIAAAETYIGLPEVHVGLIPGAGGCKEMLVRLLEQALAEHSRDIFGFVRHAWETIFTAKVSTSAQEAMRFGYLRAPPRAYVILNPDWLIGEAKAEVQAWIEEGFHPVATRGKFPVLGSEGIAGFKELIERLQQENRISEYDAVVGTELAYVLCGGSRKAGTPVTEQDILDLEREAFLRLCGQESTLLRIEHMLKTGKPLKN